jgi:hypothetical protein
MLCPIFWLHDINIHLVFSELTSKPTSLLASNKSFCIFLYSIYVSSQYINVINIGQKLVCPVQFQPFLVLLDPPNGMSQSEAEKQWW